MWLSWWCAILADLLAAFLQRRLAVDLEAKLPPCSPLPIHLAPKTLTRTFTWRLKHSPDHSAGGQDYDGHEDWSPSQPPCLYYKEQGKLPCCTPRTLAPKHRVLNILKGDQEYAGPPALPTHPPCRGGGPEYFWPFFLAPLCLGKGAIRGVFG